MSNRLYSAPAPKPLSTGTAVLGCLTLIVAALLVAFVSALVGGFVFMLILGAVHLSVSEQVPALGYWASVLIVFALRFVGGLLFGNHSTSSK